MDENLVKFYDALAAEFDDEQDRFGFIRAPEWEIAISAVRRVVRPNHSLLEIGAGTGRFTLEIAPWVRQIRAVDPSAKMLAKMTEKTGGKLPSNIHPTCGDFMEVEFDETFDVIVGFSAIEYIRDKQALFQKMASLLKPGGHIIITTNHNTFFRWWGRMGNYVRQGILMNAFSKKGIRKLLVDNGLEVRETKDLCLKNVFSKGVLLFVHATKPLEGMG